MSFSLLVNNKSIIEIAGNLSWSSNSDTLGQHLSFEMPFDVDGKLLPKRFIKIGDKVTLKYKSKVVFFGIVISEERAGRSPVQYDCFDLAFYLNKSSLTVQYNNKPADDCIKELCQKFNIKCNVTSIPTKVKKIYKEETVSDILADILTIATKQSGKKYRFEMRGDTLTVFVWRDVHVKVNAEWISEAQLSRSMEEMKNSIEIVLGDEKKVKVVANSKDNNSVKKYGLLHHSEEIDDKEKSKAKKVADNLLKELNRIQEEASVSLLGNYEARAGRLITINEPITGLTGDYLIVDAQHTLSNGIHLMSLSLEAV